MRTEEPNDDSLAILTRRHNGLLIPLSAAAQEIGINLRTAHNQISKGVFLCRLSFEIAVGMSISANWPATLIGFANELPRTTHYPKT